MVPRRPSSNRVYPTGTFRGAHVSTRAIVGLSHLKEMVAVDRGYRDGADLVVTLDAELDEVAGAARPELLVKLFLGGDRDTVDLQDPIALAEPGARRGPDRGELADEEPRGHGDGVETEPRPRRPAGDPPGVDQLVLHRHELLDGDREVHVWGLAEPARGDPDQLTPVVHDGAAAPLRPKRRLPSRAEEAALSELRTRRPTIAGSTRRTNEGRDETSPGLSRRSGAEVGAPGATVGASRSVAKANLTTRFMEPLQFRGAPRPAGPQPHDGLQHAPHFRGAPRPAGPQPRDGLQRAPRRSAMAVLSPVVGAELPGLEPPAPRFVLTIPLDGCRQ